MKANNKMSDFKEDLEHSCKLQKLTKCDACEFDPAKYAIGIDVLVAAVIACFCVFCFGCKFGMSWLGTIININAGNLHLLKQRSTSTQFHPLSNNINSPRSRSTKCFHKIDNIKSNVILKQKNNITANQTQRH
ncbi:hypothetical protein HELRODRAFT_159339 [Helobdella robusta]|uniref:Uncharacterized protein n=1 Tax=Helobdella robusta TaxID=6412 RepID=T1ENW9_HELRO|nr:hypothetical protein HELRODRAFT_159339 [Helobdella robusta]ESO12757.1 hypothetical protein HELRODRAFT_159339 [Helobdella robusta]